MSSQTKFQKFSLATIVSVYVLILVGAVVRSQGAGMGCPDWPRCFGSYVPPTSISELPADYKEAFLIQRIDKNERLSLTLENLGFYTLADRVSNDPKIHQTHEFNVIKTWIEYVNRLVGVAIGILVFINMILSFKYRKEKVIIPILGVLVFVLTGFQGWIGSLVVSTNLLPGFITFHMMLALLIVVLLIWMYIIGGHSESWKVSSRVKWVVGLFGLLLVPQIITGTLTREQVDLILDSGVLRNSLIYELRGSFYVHRSYSWLLMGLAFGTFFLLRKNGFDYWSKAILFVVLSELAIGVLLVFLNMPVILQPFHLLLATVLFGGLFYLFLRIETVND